MQQRRCDGSIGDLLLYNCCTMEIPLDERVVRANDYVGSWEPLRAGRPVKQIQSDKELDVVKYDNGSGGGGGGGRGDCGGDGGAGDDDKDSIKGPSRTF